MTTTPQQQQQGAGLVDQCIAILKTATHLNSIPDARKAAIVESLRFLRDIDDDDYQRTEERIVCIFLDVVSGSPYLTNEQKTGLTELVLHGKWEQLAPKLGCDPHRLQEQLEFNARIDAKFDDFQTMVMLLFRTSRKFAILPIERKRQLGGAILASRSNDQLMDLVIRTLPHSLTLDNDARTRVANDVLEGQFHNLLLPDRLDCDETPRQCAATPSAHTPSSTEEPEECAICLEELSENPICLPACGHSFCRPCLEGWFATYTQQGERTCPLCRQAVTTLAEPPCMQPPQEMDEMNSSSSQRRSFRFPWRRRIRSSS
mmetsp:Transcript_13164/g.28896  ORF Transcript_13164/g.28896 Transcript_13164/m.28896 type:complete len:317 (+) Transcript_13164:81-1031(+)